MFKKIFSLSRSDRNTLPLFVRNSKLMEEVGEFSEALMHKMGFLPHKTMKEPLVGEAADIILCVLDTLACAHPEISEEDLLDLLNDHIALKCDKWDRVMTERYKLLTGVENV